MLKFAILVSFLICTSLQYAHAARVDVYVVHGKDGRSLAKHVKKALKADCKVKTYNIALLRSADYSEKQKVAAKLRSAKVLILTDAKSIGIFSEEKFENILILLGESGYIGTATSQLYITEVATDGAIDLSAENAISADLFKGKRKSVSPSGKMPTTLVSVIKVGLARE